MRRLFAIVAAALALVFTPITTAYAQAEWDSVERIVAIGDLEGDYDKFADMLRTAGLVDARNRWSGGRTHLVQLGDIPDRGPNTRMILDLLIQLEPQARRAGGRVHALIGNHEAMNIEGDLRYTDPREFAAFATRNSARVRDRYYENLRRAAQRTPVAGAPVFDAAYRAQWNAEHPLGWIEHRQAWAPNGRYGRWITTHDSVIRINDTLFLHAGLGPPFAAQPRSAMNEAVRSALRGRPASAYADIATNDQGPLWYRGLATSAESAELANLQAILGAQGVTRVVIGHTKVASTVLPRFNGRVLIADIAVPAGHIDPHAFLVMENGAWVTIHRGQRVPVTASTPEETCAYLRAIAALDGNAGPVAQRVTDRCTAPAAAN